MKRATEKVTSALRARGYRVTAPRIAIITALGRSKQPQTIRALAGRVAADEASVYRTINVLEREGFTETIVLPDGAVLYALARGHHHHLVCTKCKRVAHIPCRSKKEKVPAHPAFSKILSHEVTYYGVCLRHT